MSGCYAHINRQIVHLHTYYYFIRDKYLVFSQLSVVVVFVGGVERAERLAAVAEQALFALGLERLCVGLRRQDECNSFLN